MPTEVVVPALGESVVEATVGRWLKEQGAAVRMGEPLVELETEKINLEISAPADGLLEAIARHEGETVRIGDVLATIAEAAEGAEAAAPAPGESTEAARATPAAAPGTGNGMPEQSPAATSASAAKATPLARHLADERGVDLAAIHGSGAGGRVTRDDVEEYLQHDGGGAHAAAAAAMPTARGDVSAFLPTPPGRAPRREVSAPPPKPAPPPTLQPQRQPHAPPPAPPREPPQRHGPPVEQTSSAPAAVPQEPAAESRREERMEERVRMSRRRLTIAQRLVETQHTAAMLTTFNEVDMSAVLELRARYKERFEQRHGVRLGFMSFFTRAVIAALKAYPRLNAEIQGVEIVLKRYYDIGIAVSTDEGLVVPVVRDADRLNFAEIEREVARLAERARSRQLTLDDLRGGTFTITNGGIFGSLLSTPILNGPQVGILGMHKIEERPIARDGQVVIHPMMYVALSYDHRIVDGSEAVSFLVRVKELLEAPEMLLLEG